MKSGSRYPAKSDGCVLRTLCLNDAPFTDDKLMREIERVNRHCFVVSKKARNPYEKGMKSLRKITRKISPRQLEAQNPKNLVHCSIKLLLYFQDLVYRREFGICNCSGQRKYRAATKCYLDLLRLFLPKKEPEVITAVVDVIHEEKLVFGYQELSLELLNALIIALKIPASSVVNELWNKVEDPDTTLDDRRAVIHLLYEFMDSYDWPIRDDTVACVERLLRIYRASFGQEGQDPGAKYQRYKFLKKGLKVCVQRTVEHLTNYHILVVIRHMCSWTVDPAVKDDDVLEFGSSLEYAAFRHETKLLGNTLTPEILSLVTRMIESHSRLVSLLGNRVMQYLLDRGNNMSRFETPQVFFEDTEYDLNVNVYHREDKIFLKNNRAELHGSLIKGVLNHCSTRLNLETSYCTICLLAVEVPCGFTAAALVCLAMNLQDRTLEREDIRREVTFHIHASVVAILSLLCWIHRAKVFYQYVNKIVMERARWAPHLNPPLQSHYYFAKHHVLWDKPELFFVDWEARYGLWKCFRMLES